MSESSPWIALSIDWQDSEMFDDASHGERLAWICLLCHAKAAGRGGRVRIRDRAFAAQYRLTAQAVDGMLARAASGGAITRQGDEVTLTKWSQYQHGKKVTTKGGNSGSRSFRETPQIPPTDHRSQITDHRSPSTGVGDKPPPRPRFVKPTVEEVAAYCRERDNGIDPQVFIDHYESNGWRVGKNPMKDWRATIRKWEKNEFNRKGGKHGRPIGPAERHDPGHDPNF